MTTGARTISGSTCPELAILADGGASQVVLLCHRGTCHKCLRECPP